MAKQVGTVIQVMGPVLDIRFPEGCLPRLLNAVEVPNGDETIVAEVAQHLGDNVVRAGHGYRRTNHRAGGGELFGPDVQPAGPAH